MGTGDAIVFVGLIMLAAYLTYEGIKNKNIMIGIIASIAWIFFWVYEKSNLPTGIVMGSAGQNFITVVCLGIAIGLPIVCLTFWRGEKKYNERDEQEFQFKVADRKAQHKPTYSDITSTSNSVDMMNMSDSEYMHLLQGQRNQKRRRR
jgi:hypothetical protein